MTTKTVIITLSSIAVVTVGYFAVKKLRKPKNVKDFNSAVKSGLLATILRDVIAENNAKNYDDVLPLDGGTVGIAHFAVGGLAELYNEMDTQKYFGKSREEMINKYSNSCRPSGKSGNDTGWGCYSKDWWREGMTKFVKSSESKRVQDKTWFKKMEKVVNNAISKGWTKPRQIAIATGVANSLGAGGFNSLASANGWDAEKVLVKYTGTIQHRKSRAAAINKHFPI